MYTIQDPIFGPVRGQATQVLTKLPKGEVVPCIYRVYQVCNLIGIDPSIVISQMGVETADFTSLFWTRDGNPGGIGIDGDNSSTHTTTSPFQPLAGAQSADVHLATLYLKVKGNVPLPDILRPIETLLPEWFQHTRQMVSDPQWPKIQTIDDLNIHFSSTVTGHTEATWAWDETYQTQIVKKAMAYFGEGTIMTTVTFGKVPFPNVDRRYVTDAQSGAWDNLGPRKVKGVVWHRMLGTLWGTDGWFRRGNGVSDGLTEFGVGTANIDGAANDGYIIQWNDSTGAPHPGVSANRAPWASGPVDKPYGDGLAFLNDNNYDLNVVNRDEAAIEISGNYNDPVSDKARAAVVHLTAYWADQAQIPWDQFPIVNGKDYSFVRWHQEFTIGSGKICPGPVVMNLTDQMIAEIKEYMKGFQTMTVPAPTPKPAVQYQKPGPVPKQDGYDHVINGVTFFACQKNVRILADKADCHIYADPKSGLTRKPLVKGQAFTAAWLVKGSDGKPWWVSPHGSRIQCADTDGLPTF